MDLKNEDDKLPITLKSLTEEDKIKLNNQSTRLVPEFQANQLEQNAQKHWDLFYKRNETRFFKDRNWTTREFEELIMNDRKNDENDRKTMLEVGCGVGNLIFPLIKEKQNNYFIYACDFSRRAIEFVKKNSLYNEANMKAFSCDITTANIFDNVPKQSLDIVTLVFVLSAIHPSKFFIVFQNIINILRPGGILLFRDYARYDMTQIRFKAGHKIAENFYMRQDGTR